MNRKTAVGRAALGAISEGGEAFVEDIFQPMLVINGAASITAGRTQNAPVSAGSNSVTMRIADYLALVKDSEEFNKRLPVNEVLKKENAPAAIKTGVTVQDGVTGTAETSSANSMPESGENVKSYNAVMPRDALHKAENRYACALLETVDTLS